MADVSIANLPAFTGTPTATDLFPMVDTADTSESPLGTTKRVTFGQATSTNPGPASFGGDGYAITLTNPTNVNATAIRFMPAGVEQAVIGVNKGNGLLGTPDSSFVIRTNNQPIYIAAEGASGMLAMSVLPATRQVGFSYAVVLTQPSQVAAPLIGTAGTNGDLQLQPNTTNGVVSIRNSANQQTAAFTGTSLGLFVPGTTPAIGALAWSPSSVSLGTVTNNPLQFQTNTVVRWQIQAAGHLVPNADNAYDIGVSGIPRVRSVYAVTFNGMFLVLNQTSTSGGATPLLTLNNSSTTANGIQITLGSPANFTDYYLQCTSTTTNFVAYTNGGLSNVVANNVDLSDGRLKDVGDTVDGALWYDRLKALAIRHFKYIDPGLGTKPCIGVVAQDVELIAPELVTEIAQWKRVYTGDLQYAHLAVTQELQRRLEALEAKLVQ